MSLAILLQVQDKVGPAATRCAVCGAKAYLIRIVANRKNHFKVLLCDVLHEESSREDQLIFGMHVCDQSDARLMRQSRQKPEITLPGEAELNRRRPKGCGESAGFERRFETNETIDPDQGGDD